MTDLGKRQLKQDDVKFINSVLEDCKIPATGAPPPPNQPRDCVQKAYEHERYLLMQRMGIGLASQEANHPIEQHIALQRKLQDLGFLPAAATIDGVYGATTRAAISEWQRSQSRPVTGFLADADAAALPSSAGRSGTVDVAENRPDIAPTTSSSPTAPTSTASVSNLNMPALDRLQRTVDCESFMDSTVIVFHAQQNSPQGYDLAKYLLNRDNLNNFIVRELERAKTECGARFSKRGIDIFIGDSPMGYTFFRATNAHYAGPSEYKIPGHGDWMVSNFMLSQIVEQHERQQAQQAAAAKEAADKQKIRTDFLSTNHASRIVGIEELQRNPFIYKDQIVAVYVAFERMKSESSAEFSYPDRPGIGLYAEKVPPTLFRGNSLVVLAIKVRGLKEGMAYGDLLGQYFCQKQGCQDFF